MFDFFKNLLKSTQPLTTGALLDTRTVKEKEIEDINFKDIVASVNAVNWTVKTPRSFPSYNQNYTLACGANALAKALGIAYSHCYGIYIPFSRVDIYQRRINAPGGGMSLWDMFDIASKGVTLEQLTPGNFRNDEELDKAVIESFKKEIGAVFKTTGGVYLPNDIEQIASVIQTTGKGVILLTYFLSSEWSVSFPKIQNRILKSNDPSSLRHFVVAVDFMLRDGKKYLVIEDSALFGGLDRRFLSEDWIKNRVVSAAYPMNFRFSEGANARPSYDGITIISLQQCLRFEGIFPNNISLVESLGPITKNALEAFQKKYVLPVTRMIDTQTKNKLHQLYP